MASRTRTFLRISVAGVAALGLSFAVGCSNVKAKKQSKPIQQDDDAVVEEETEQTVAEFNQLEVSREAFRLTVYPIARVNCGGCHGGSTAPNFAAEDAKVAHDATVDNHKVDFTDLKHSRLVMRLSRDAHNCWTADCADDATKMQDAVAEWAKKIEEAGGDVSTQKFDFVTEERAFTGATEGGDAGPAIPGTVGLLAEASSAVGGTWTLKNDDPDGGIGATQYLTPSAADAQNAAVVFDFTVDRDGDYGVYIRAKSTTNANNSVNFRVDGLPATFNQSGTRTDKTAEFVWNRGSTVGANYAETAGNFPTMRLTKGVHKLELAAREPNIKISAIAVSDQNMFTLVNLDSDLRVAFTGGKLSVLEFSLKELTGKNAKLIVEVSEFDEVSHAVLISGMRIETDGPIKIKDVMPLINGKFNPLHATFRLVDMTVEAPGAELSSAALVAIGEEGFAKDKLSFAFGEIK